MIRTFAKASMLLAAVSLATHNALPAFAAQPKFDRRQIDRCVSDVERRAQRMHDLPKVIVETAKRMCWISEDRKAGAGMLAFLNYPGLQQAFEKGRKNIKVRGFKEIRDEPGLLGLDGAREVMAQMLRAEVQGIWKLAEAVGGPPVPKLGTTTSTKKSGGLTYTQTDINATNDFAKAYVDAHIRALEADPDTQIILKTRMYRALKAIALKSPGARTADEQRYLASFNDYMRDQYIYMAETAIRKHDEYIRKMEDERAKSVIAGAVPNLSFPPDYLAEMRAALALSAEGLALAAAIAGGAAHVAAASTAISAAAAQAAAEMAAAGAAQVAVTTAVADAALEASAAASLSTGMSSAAAAGAAAVVVMGAIVAVVGIEKVIKNKNVVKEMNKALAWAKSGRVSARSMFGTREGTIAVQHFFAKATSSSSPAGFEDTTGQCGACFFADKDFQGDQFCTNAKVGDLRGVSDAGKNLTDKVSSVMLAQESCPQSYVVLYNKRRLTGDKVVLKSSIADLAELGAGKRGNWDNRAGSVMFRDQAAPQCEVCLFAQTNYQGRKACLTGGNANMKAFAMNNTVASVRLATKDCPKAKAWLYRKKDLKRGSKEDSVLEVTQSIRQLDRSMRNRVSSAYFAHDGRNPYEETATGGCRACLYDHAGHKGDYLCVNQNIPDMNRVEVAGEDVKFRNKTSSVQFVRDDCKAGEELVLELYTKPDYRGQTFRFFGKDATKLQGKFNNSVSSAKLKHTSARLAAQRCQVCLYADDYYQGAEYCTNGEVTKLPTALRNKVSSIRLETPACKKAGAQVFTRRNFKGDVGSVERTRALLKNVKRGRNGHWNNTIASVRFVRDLEAAQAKAKAALKALGIDTKKAEKQKQEEKKKAQELIQNNPFLKQLLGQ